MRLVSFLLLCWLWLFLPVGASSFQPTMLVSVVNRPVSLRPGFPVVSTSSNRLTRPSTRSSTSSTTQLNLVSTKVAATAAVALLRGGARVLLDEEEIISAAYDWCTNLGNPSALVAGAVIATIYETMSSGDLDLKKGDERKIKIMKKGTRLLLLSAFALEVFSIFVTTVTGTMLLSRTYDIPESKHYSAMSFLRENFEFEYLTARLTFLQGLLNWLAAIGLSHAIPKGESGAMRKINKLVAYSLCCTGILMISFWNNHLTYYSNYASMVSRWWVVTWHRFIWRWPPLPMALVLVPSVVMCLKTAYEAFMDDSTDDTATDS